MESSSKPGGEQIGINEVNILLMEREHLLRKAIVMSLEQIGFHIVQAGTIEQARECIEDLLPDILILDLDFPADKSGELIQFCRQKCEGKKAAVFVITTERPEDCWRLKYCPDAILYKPLDVRYLIQRLQAFL